MVIPSVLNIKTIIGVIVFTGASISAGLFADDRYAKTEDLQKYMIFSSHQMAQAANILRKQMLEDKIFELDLIPDNQKTDVQRAMVNRNRTQLQDIQAQITSESTKRTQ